MTRGNLLAHTGESELEDLIMLIASRCMGQQVTLKLYQKAVVELILGSRALQLVAREVGHPGVGN